MTIRTAGRRPTWTDLPAAVRRAIEARTGAVAGWTSHDGGYSPGLASTLRTAQGPVFVKAVPVEHEFAAHLYRQEAQRSALLDEAVPASRLLWSVDVDAGDGRDWAVVAGDRLVHNDLRGDNALIVTRGPRAGRAVAVDWAYPGRGAAFCDLVGMLPAVEVEGGPPPEEALRRRPLPQGTDEDAVTAYLVAITGYFVHASLQPPPPGIPHVRAFQRAQGEAGIAWLRRRLG